MTEEIKRRLDISRWSIREALNNSNGKSSVGLFLAFVFGIANIVIAIYSAFNSYNDGLMFVGTQMPFIFGYLGYRVHATKSSNNELEGAQDAD